MLCVNNSKVLMEPVQNWTDSFHKDVKCYGYRWYFPHRVVGFASENGKNFSRWIQRFKGNDPIALWLFAKLFDIIIYDFLRKPDLIISFPSHEKYKSKLDHHMAQLVTKICQMRFYKGAANGAFILRRTIDVEKGIRDRQKHIATIEVTDYKNRIKEARHILIIDDVATTGASLSAATELVFKYHLYNQAAATNYILEPNQEKKKITCFAFGRTYNSYIKEDLFPEFPIFPESRDIKSVGMEPVGLSDFSNQWVSHLHKIKHKLKTKCKN